MIEENVRKLLQELPAGIELVAAAKARTADEIEQAIAAGVEIIGENYLQEAERAFKAIGRNVKWHFIGHLQKNKVKKAVEIFDMIETVDSERIAQEIDRACASRNKTMPVLLEINSGREKQKAGVMPEEARALIEKISSLKNIKIEGLMTMGPYSGEPEVARPYFSRTRKLFEKIKALNLPNVEMKYLSMGMTNSYRIAMEEGANIVRIGSKIFGEREKR
ncbi:MAG: YggS family pyridoxal phosphate-dependent enzyme [Candidatus Omnitrophota bacterium]|nr:MAG: YggS family pyridoxal phosphate-dependent enzyme [Candidatus Omnitrophota bacterium]